MSPAPQLRSAAADVVWLLIWLLQPRYQSRQVNTALGFTTTSHHQQPDTDTQHGLRFNTGDIQKCGCRVVLGYYYDKKRATNKSILQFCLEFRHQCVYLSSVKSSEAIKCGVIQW